MGAKRRKLCNHAGGHYSYASYDLKDEWEASCARAMGMEWRAEKSTMEDGTSAEPTMNKVINLLPPSMLKKPAVPVKTDSPSHCDHWLESAIEISKGLDHMSSLIRRKRQAYASVPLVDDAGGMTEEERSVLESTVLSFSATTANQIESLRQQADTSQEHDEKEAHRAGIVACLFQRLRREVADPMAALQKERNKNRAVGITKEPLRCEYTVESVGEDYDELLDGPPPDKRFLPRSRMMQTKVNVQEYYANENITLPPLPESQIIAAAKKYQQQQQATIETAVPAETTPSVRFQHQPNKTTNQQPPSQTVLPYNHNQEEHQARLEQESALLLAELHSDLDGVQKVEQTMTEITSLLTQFSNLVAEQQEEIMAIHDDTVQSKSNVTKGQDSLLEARQRAKQSKHYMATFVVCMALVLLFYNWLKP